MIEFKLKDGRYIWGIGEIGYGDVRKVLLTENEIIVRVAAKLYTNTQSFYINL
jgi:hypothetical protein